MLKRCLAAEPHHGEHWCSVSKLTANGGKSTEQLLKAVASEISANATKEMA